MLKRIVKLTFRTSEVETFLTLFEASKYKIRSVEGCLHLELLRVAGEGNVFFTYSFWTEASALQSYRESELFKQTWSNTKVLFADKPEAWSVEVISEVE